MRYFARQKVVRREIDDKTERRAWEEVWHRAGREVLNKIMNSVEVFGGVPLVITIRPAIYNYSDPSSEDEFVMYFDIEGDRVPTIEGG